MYQFINGHLLYVHINTGRRILWCPKPNATSFNVKFFYLIFLLCVYRLKIYPIWLLNRVVQTYNLKKKLFKNVISDKFTGIWVKQCFRVENCTSDKFSIIKKVVQMYNNISDKITGLKMSSLYVPYLKTRGLKNLVKLDWIVQSIVFKCTTFKNISLK